MCFRHCAGGEYPVEVEGEEFEDSDSDATELYEILANITEPEEEANLGVEPELESDSPKAMNLRNIILTRNTKEDFVNMVTIGNAMGTTIPVAF